MDLSYWEKYYRDTPLDQIPWQRTQADYFKHSVDNGKITGKTALDLGCGAGAKSTYLAEKGFDVIGVDISPSAIEYAQKEAEDKGLATKCNFIVSDITDLDQIDDRRFDFILDWAALHCLDRSKHEKYLSEILKLSHSGTLMMLRVFSSKDKAKDHFVDKIKGSQSKVAIMQKSEIETLFNKYFDILEFKTSKPIRKDNLIFLEFLMRRK